MGGVTDRTDRSKITTPYLKQKHIQNIMNFQKSYIQAKEKAEKDKLRDNIHRRRQVLENQPNKDLSASPMVMKGHGERKLSGKDGVMPLKSIKAVFKAVDGKNTNPHNSLKYLGGHNNKKNVQ